LLVVTGKTVIVVKAIRGDGDLGEWSTVRGSASR